MVYRNSKQKPSNCQTYHFRSFQPNQTNFQTTTTVATEKTQPAYKAKDMKRKQNKQPKSKAQSKLKIHVKKSERKKSESHFSVFSARFDFVCCTRECC